MEDADIRAIFKYHPWSEQDKYIKRIRESETEPENIDNDIKKICLRPKDDIKELIDFVRKNINEIIEHIITNYSYKSDEQIIILAIVNMLFGSCGEIYYKRDIEDVMVI